VTLPIRGNFQKLQIKSYRPQRIILITTLLFFAFIYSYQFIIFMTTSLEGKNFATDFEQVLKIVH